jgi:hypothetical protein
VADHRHKRDADARRKPRAAFVAGPIALLATASAVTLGVLATDSSAGDLVAKDTTAHDTAATGAATASPAVPRRDAAVSRAGSRLDAKKLQQAREAEQEQAATLRAVRAADTRLWTTTLLNLWSDSTSEATQVGTVDAGKHVLVTGRKADGRVELVIDGRSRWVTAGYLSDEKPAPEPAPEEAAARTAAPAGLSMAPCPDPGVESGLTSQAVYVYRSVCHAFPQITSYGGWDGHGEHSSGRALDIMTSDKALGDQIADFLQAHASELDLYDVIWWDQIWTPVRSSEGWRDYGDHGSATANHMDHVHVSTNG